MSGTSLSKLLRLAGGTTQGYVHIVKGKPVTVSSYRTPHPAQQMVPAGPPLKSESWGTLKVGQTVVIRSVPYKVLKVGVRSRTGAAASKGVNTSKQGSGLNTASNFAVTTAATAAKQAANAKLFGTTAQNPQSALMQGKTSAGGQNMTALLQQTKTGQYFYVSVPTGTPVSVMR